MNIVFFVVNYKTDGHVIRLIESLNASRLLCSSVSVSIHIFDNSLKSTSEADEFHRQLTNLDPSIKLHRSSENLGYFGGLSVAQSLVTTQTDCIIYSNPDILLNLDFFSALSLIGGKSPGIVAPSIVSLADGVELNPLYLQRVNETKLARLKKIYSNRFSYMAFNFLANAKTLVVGQWQSRQPQPTQTPTEIYAAHGALMIFTDLEFFSNLPIFPCFLYGEELFVAEEARKSGVVTMHEPSLRILDQRHASVAKLGSEFRRQFQLESVTFILDRYYNETSSAKTA